jgi:hypothetical protein
MSFDYQDLNMQFMPQDWGQTGHWGPCPFFSQPPCFTPRPCTFRPTCLCVSSPIASVCIVPTRCRCVSRLLTCICLSKPIASVPPRTLPDFTIYEQVTGVLREVGDPSDFEVLRTELQAALKQVDMQEQWRQGATPQSDAEFDAPSAGSRNS